MGEPIRIVDLAEHMIRLAGLVPYEDIEIQFTGLRPGEKLLEEINGKGEGILPTDQEKMRVIREQPLSWHVIPDWIESLQELLASRREMEIIEHIRRLVPEYSPASRLHVADQPMLTGDGFAHRNGSGPSIACEH
jgi:FlaA1/EpsC-like NDP-sugar epimerase